MESLLTLSFDNISSKNPKKVGKGFRQIEGLLAQICISPSQSQHGLAKQSLSSSVTEHNVSPPPQKHIYDLVDDPAFREFFRLQESFEWNGTFTSYHTNSNKQNQHPTNTPQVATRLIETLDRLLGLGNGTDINLLIASALDLLQGTLLLHPPSRTLFGRERNMNLLLDLLDPLSSPSILQATLHVLVCALLDHPHNTRVFENVDGILTLTSLFKSRSTPKELKLKVIEFLYFYLMPETGDSDMAGARPVTAIHNGQQMGGMLQRSPSKTARSDSSGSSEGEGETKTTEEKQALLSRHLNNVEDLAQDLREHRPFAVGGAGGVGVTV